MVIRLQIVLLVSTKLGVLVRLLFIQKMQAQPHPQMLRVEMIHSFSILPSND